MDSYMQGILERAEKRSKALGVSTPKIDLSKYTSDSSGSSRSARKPEASPRKATVSDMSTKQTTRNVRNYQAVTETTTDDDGDEDQDDSKENCDLAVEISIMTGKNVEVDVQVAECEIDEDGNITKQVNKTKSIDKSASVTESRSLIRDTSRNRLQRLGTLYSDNQDLSSPIHRTEGAFHETLAEKSAAIQKRKFGKLAALANTINSWEDDPSHPDYKHHRETIYDPKSSDRSPKKTSGSSPPKFLGATRKKTTTVAAPEPPKSILQAERPVPEKVPTKQLKWDQKIMDSLESQGFKKRESNDTKLTYDYSAEDKDNVSNKAIEKEATESPKKAIASTSQVQAPMESPKRVVDPMGRGGMVSDRAAIFESSKLLLSPKKNTKDPTELSLKDRMAIFEKNKGSAPIPKAPFAAAPPIKQIQQQKFVVKKPTPAPVAPPTPKSPQQQLISNFNQPVVAETKAAGPAIQKTMEALKSGGATISEAKIAEDNRKQRQQEMDVLMNRYKTVENSPIPTAPPQPPANFFDTQMRRQSHVEAKAVVVTSHKRRSDERNLDEGDHSQDSPEVRSTLDDVKRIRVSGPKQGQLYPALSDIESTTGSDTDNYMTASATEESEMREYRFHNARQTVTTTSGRRGADEYYFEDDNECSDSFMDSEDGQADDDVYNGSLGREIMRAVQRNETKPKSMKRVSIGRSPQIIPSGNSSNSELSDVLADMDGYLDEALDQDSDDEQEQTPKGSMSSNSFSYERNPRHKHVHYQKIDEDNETDDSSNYQRSPRKNDNYRSPVKSELEVKESAEDSDLVTLVHTVSFYRRQQQTTSSSVSNTPIRKVTRNNNGHEHRQLDFDDSDLDSSDADRRSENRIAVQDKVRKLLAEVEKQQTIISQTSQALNLCAATVEFSGSTESVEAERLLLIATNRRQACLDEVQRLRVDGCIRLSNLPKEKGRLTIKEITLPLRQDYIRKLASDAISGHHLVCLLKYNENVLATKTIPTLPGLLSAKFMDVLTLNNVYADFKITLEIYGMTAQREVLPHEIKYHIGAAGKSKANKMLTPKGRKPQDSRLFRPPVQSPAGPQAVRTPGLVQYGFIIFSLREINRTSWTISPVAGISPLDGSVNMRVNCELSVNVDYRGFLTMFEDVSGFGAWHRRWCRLTGLVINYWKYPDDEKKKAPMGTIELDNCTTQHVALAPRDICARLNTIMLECQRPSYEADVESQMLVKQGRMTTVRYLLSADTKEEREEWCGQLNKTLALMRAWGKRD